VSVGPERDRPRPAAIPGVPITFDPFDDDRMPNLTDRENQYIQ